MGRGKSFDPNRFFIFCANVLGSPYGTASPITLNPDTDHPYGPEFPQTSIRDDVRCVRPALRNQRATQLTPHIARDQTAQACARPPRRVARCSRHRRIHGRHGRPRMASLQPSRVHPPYHPPSHLRPTLGVVHQLG